MSELMPVDPIELVYDEAVMYRTVESEGFLSEAYEKQMLGRLHEQTEAYRLEEQSYAVHANTALLLPRRVEEHDSMVMLHDVPLEARFESYDVLRLPLNNGQEVWRMLSVRFDDVLLQPDGDSIPEHRTLHVPVLEVGKIACLGFRDN